jgi:hypothetical protein
VHDSEPQGAERFPAWAEIEEQVPVAPSAADATQAQEPWEPHASPYEACFQVPSPPHASQQDEACSQVP